MREILNNQYSFGEEDIAQVKIDIKSRDDIPKILLGLQSIYADSKTREKIFQLLEKIQSEEVNKKVGRPGMHLWQIFVLAMLRLGLNCDYDRLQQLANEHKTLRKILGIGPMEEMYYELKTIKNNIRLFTPELLDQINNVIVNFGHTMCSGKKKTLHVKCDSFVLETNVHFPTDSNLLYDAIRKTIKLTAKLCKKYQIIGWRQINYNIKKIKSICRAINKIKKSNPRKPEMVLAKEQKLQKAYNKLIKRSEAFIEKSKIYIEILKNKFFVNDFEEIEHFIFYAKLLIGQIKKRVFQGEKIPHNEKIFSVFQTHTEWICKGKAKAPFELGKRISIVEDQYGFILNATVMERQTDDKVAVPIIQKTKIDFENLSTCSFDKGYYSKENSEELSKILDLVVLPKKGRLSKKDQERENSKTFKKYRKKHPAVESAINALEVHGLDRCLDKGLNGFKRYVALAVASRNIQKIGAIKLMRLQKKLVA